MSDQRKATPGETLERHITDPCIPKSEAEWWAHREIAKQREESKNLRAEIERLRAEKEALYASIVGIERAAAGAIYSQESIHAMALYALKSLEVKP